MGYYGIFQMMGFQAVTDSLIICRICLGILGNPYIALNRALNMVPDHPKKKNEPPKSAPWMGQKIDLNIPNPKNVKLTRREECCSSLGP